MGGVTTIFAERLVPLTVKLCAADTKPAQVLNAFKVPEVVTVCVTGGPVLKLSTAK